MNLIAVHGGHSATVSFYANGRYHNLELERLFRRRHYSLFQVVAPRFADTLGLVLRYARDHWGIENNFDVCASMVLPTHQRALEDTVRAREYRNANHHHSHATSALYQSPYPEALIIAFDGGGNDGFFNVYVGRKGEELRYIAGFPINLGTAYGLFAFPIREIRATDKTSLASFLSLAGKIMGLASYGTVRDEWKEPFERFYKRANFINFVRDLKTLGTEIGEDLRIDAISGHKGYDIAATSQWVFEKLALELLEPYLRSIDLPLCLSGGCALNVLLNERLRIMKGNRIFIPPNPDDGGLAFGMLVDITRPSSAVCTTYSGLPILDSSILELAVREYRAKPYTLEGIAQLLREGKILGVMRDDSEHGPRALGNRSILCDPSNFQVKDLLNLKVKYREWFRPFAPVVCEEDVRTYFDLDMPSPYMSFAAKVKAQWLERIPSIVHVDGTARVQTVNQEQHPWLYGLLQAWKKVSPHGVLLNTSFNIKGNPILTTVKDALEVLNSTEIDGIVIGPWLFKRDSP